MEEDEYLQNEPTVRKVVKILEGPKNYQWRKSSFHFYDPHNHYIYCVPDQANVFFNGIKFSYFDVALDRGHFKEGLLRFACSNDDVFRQFTELNFRIKRVIFSTEVQHGVFLLYASSKWAGLVGVGWLGFELASHYH